MLTTLEQLRRELHRYPELSGQEQQTAKRIKTFVEAYKPTQIIEQLGGNGVAVIYDFGQGGMTVVVRCELDALPIQEYNDIAYVSTMAGVSHKCGHDGHMAIVAGLALWLHEQSFAQGRVVLLFQPAEENGQGAYAVLQDARFVELRPDYMFALHNIPKEPLGDVFVVANGFSASVQSCSIVLKGKECHASQPENGNNPALAIGEVVRRLAALQEEDPSKNEFAILTPVYMQMGDRAYGISPAQGEVHYTIRAWTNEAMQAVQAKIETIVATVSETFGLGAKVDWFEYFPATINASDCNAVVRRAAQIVGANIVEKKYPYKFGEDFGWFATQYESAMFGLGAGVDTPALHHNDYDFPDELLPRGVQLFQAIITEVLA